MGHSTEKNNATLKFKLKLVVKSLYFSNTSNEQQKLVTYLYWPFKTLIKLMVTNWVRQL